MKTNSRQSFKHTTAFTEAEIATQWQGFVKNSFRPYRLGSVHGTFPAATISAKHRTDLTDLPRVLIQELPTEADVNTLWAMVRRGRKTHIKLKVTFTAPVKAEFGLIFEPDRDSHLQFLHQLAATGKMIVFLDPDNQDVFSSLPFEVEQFDLARLISFYTAQQIILKGLGVVK